MRQVLGRRFWLALGTAVLVVSMLSAAAPSTAGAVASALDPTFGAGGRVTTDLGGTYDWAYATARLALQSDGQAVAVGISETDFALARFALPGSSRR